MQNLKQSEKIIPLFLVHISKTENNSWQGYIEQSKTETKHKFGSLLELICLIAGFLDIPEESKQIRSWENDEGSIEKQIAPFLQSMNKIKTLLNKDPERKKPH